MALGVRKYGPVGLTLAGVLLVALWLLTTGGLGGSAEQGPDEWTQALGVMSGVPDGARSQSGLSIVTYPDGAEIRLDFDSVGVTPLHGHDINAGTYLLSIAKEGYLTYDTLLTVRAGQRPNLYVALQAWGSLDAARVPAQVLDRGRGGGAAEAGRQGPSPAPVAARGGLRVISPSRVAVVWVNGERVGETPLSFEGAPAGLHTIEVRTEAGDVYRTEVEVEPGDTATVEAVFGEERGRLAVLVHPWGSIYINGQLRRQETDVQYQAELPAGVHEVRVEHPVLGHLTRQVEIEAGVLRQVVIDMNQQGSAARSSAGAPDEGGVPAAPPERPQPPDEGGAASEPAGGIYTVAEEPPVLIGGLEELHRKARYPEKAYAFGREGRVFLQFIVDEEGRVQDPVVTRGLGMGCDEEALRVIAQARFVPGKVDGRPVRVRHALSINFQMDQ